VLDDADTAATERVLQACLDVLGEAPTVAARRVRPVEPL